MNLQPENNLKQRRAMKHYRTIGAVVVLLLILVHPGSGFAALTTPRDYINRQQASVTSGIQHEVFFTTGSAVSGGAGVNKVIVTFPDGDDTLWCRTAGTLTVTGIANPTGATESATVLPGTLAGTCAQGSGSGAADSNRDRLILTGVDNLSATTKYGVRAVANTAVLGTSAAGNNIAVVVKTNNGTVDVDSSTLALSLIANDQVTVTATVDVTLTVTLSANSAALGTLSASQVNQQPITSTVSTSAGNGYISLVKYDATLTSGGNTFPDTAGGTIVAGESEYGASSSDAGNTIGIWSPTTCANTASTSNATALSTTFKDFASSTTAATNEATTLCFLASISGSQAPGTYTSTATLVTTARF
jgi:hypothetical protein